MILGACLKVDRFKDVGVNLWLCAHVFVSGEGQTRAPFLCPGVEKMLELLEDVEVEPAAKVRRKLHAKPASKRFH